MGLVLDGGHFASVVAAELDARPDDLERAVPLERVVRGAVAQVQSTLEQTQILRRFARNPLVHRPRLRPKVPGQKKTLMTNDVIAVSRRSSTMTSS